MFLLHSRLCLAIWKVQRVMFGSLSSQSSPEGKYRPMLDYSMDGVWSLQDSWGAGGSGRRGHSKSPRVICSGPPPAVGSRGSPQQAG